MHSSGRMTSSVVFGASLLHQENMKEPKGPSGFNLDVVNLEYR